MPREHAHIKMTEDELTAYLASFDRLVLATLDDDDNPWADVVAYRFLDGRVYFRVPTGTRSAAHLARDDRVCCVVESKPDISSYYDIKGAMLHGHAEPLAAESAPDVREALGQVPDPVVAALRAEGSIFSVGLEDSTSFAFEKIRYRYEDRSL
jgi:nitroimidazol reductase NimA-like FMN-containing flavoprotein (pyridoxamine 5'-phosphate oxidase superfamily)